MEDMVRFIQLLNLELEGFSFTDHPRDDCHSRDRRFANRELLGTDEVEALGHPNDPDAIMKIAKKTHHTCKLDQW